MGISGLSELALVLEAEAQLESMSTALSHSAFPEKDSAHPEQIRMKSAPQCSKGRAAFSPGHQPPSSARGSTEGWREQTQASQVLSAWEDGSEPWKEGKDGLDKAGRWKTPRWGQELCLGPLCPLHLQPLVSVTSWAMSSLTFWNFPRIIIQNNTDCRALNESDFHTLLTFPRGENFCYLFLELHPLFLVLFVFSKWNFLPHSPAVGLSSHSDGNSSEKAGSLFDELSPENVR